MNMKEPLIKANRVFKYSISFQATNEESREVSDFSDSGFIIENETDEIGDILKLAQQTYGIYYPIAFGVWESTSPEQNAKYFEKGIETYYGLFIKNEDGTDITEEEYDFITFLLSDGNYNKSEFTDYAVGGVVLGALALGVGGLIAYYYFNKRKKGYPTGRAWTKEHYHDNEDEDYEVEPSKRKVPARNRKYVNGGGVGEIKLKITTSIDSFDKHYDEVGFTKRELSLPKQDVNKNWYVTTKDNSIAEQLIEDGYVEKYSEGGGVDDRHKVFETQEYYAIKNENGWSLGYKGSSSELQFSPHTMPITFISKQKAQEFIDRNLVKNPFIKKGVVVKLYADGGTTTTRPTTTPEVVPDTDTKPSKPKTPFQPKHIPKPKARKYDFILIK